MIRKKYRNAVKISNLHQHICNRIRARRLELSLTAADVTRELTNKDTGEKGVAVAGYYDFESARCTIKLRTLEEIAAALKVPVFYFFQTEDGEPFESLAPAEQSRIIKRDHARLFKN